MTERWQQFLKTTSQSPTATAPLKGSHTPAALCWERAANDRPYDTVDIGLSGTGDREGRPYGNGTAVRRSVLLSGGVYVG